MAWQSIGPNTWRQGRFTLYKSLMPDPAYWLSIDKRDPIRFSTREQVQARIQAIIKIDVDGL